MTRTRFERIAVGLVATFATAWVYAAVVQGQSGMTGRGSSSVAPASVHPSRLPSAPSADRSLRPTRISKRSPSSCPRAAASTSRTSQARRPSGRIFRSHSPCQLPGASVEVAADGALVIDPDDLARFIGARPADYSFNNTSINAASVHAAGNLGAGIITAVIDSGTANSPVVPALAGTVIGGESFVAADPVASATSRRNGPHGTWVGTVIAGHANFLFANTSTLVRSLRIHAPSSVIACTPALGCPATASIVPMVGVAPASKIYALKVFPSTVDSAPSSRVIAAMDRAITLRRNFNIGMPSIPVSGDGSEDNPFVFNSLKIDVVNMSLGGATFFAGRELDELLTTEMLSVGIVPAVSAGNEGFGAMTAAGPGDGVGALGTAAANDAVHERVLRDLQSRRRDRCPVPADHAYPDRLFQLSRSHGGRALQARHLRERLRHLCAGDMRHECGRVSPEPASPGSAWYPARRSPHPPWRAHSRWPARPLPAAPSVALRNALIDTANPNVLGDGSGPIDQGQGYLDVGAAIASLQNGQQSLGLDFSTPSSQRPQQHQRHWFHDGAPAAWRVLDASGRPRARAGGAVLRGNANRRSADRQADEHHSGECPGESESAVRRRPGGYNSSMRTTSTNQELFPQTFIAADSTISVTAVARHCSRGDSGRLDECRPYLC